MSTFRDMMEEFRRELSESYLGPETSLEEESEEEEAREEDKSGESPNAEELISELGEVKQKNLILYKMNARGSSALEIVAILKGVTNWVPHEGDSLEKFKGSPIDLNWLLVAELDAGSGEWRVVKSRATKGAKTLLRDAKFRRLGTEILWDADKYRQSIHGDYLTWADDHELGVLCSSDPEVDPKEAISSYFSGLWGSDPSRAVKLEARQTSQQFNKDRKFKNYVDNRNKRRDRSSEERPSVKSRELEFPRYADDDEVRWRSQNRW